MDVFACAKTILATALTLHSMVRASAEARRAAVSRLEQLRAGDALTTAHVELVADSLGVAPRTVWRWLAGQGSAPVRPRRDRFHLSDTDREAYAYYRGNVSAIARAREAVLDRTMTTAGAQ